MRQRWNLDITRKGVGLKRSVKGASVYLPKLVRVSVTRLLLDGPSNSLVSHCSSASSMSSASDTPFASARPSNCSSWAGSRTLERKQEEFSGLVIRCVRTAYREFWTFRRTIVQAVSILRADSTADCGFYSSVSYNGDKTPAAIQAIAKAPNNHIALAIAVQLIDPTYPSDQPAVHRRKFSAVGIIGL